MRRADRQDDIRRLLLREEVRRLPPGREEGLTQDVSLFHELKVLVSRARSGRRDGEDFHWKDLQSHSEKRSERESARAEFCERTTHLSAWICERSEVLSSIGGGDSSREVERPREVQHGTVHHCRRRKLYGQLENFWM